MIVPIYQVDAFSSRLFRGNPAAVCILENWPEDSLMQQIAGENNLSETAFVVPSGEGYAIRWFTPVSEVDLCGHATLASAHVLFEHLNHSSGKLDFHSPRSGYLSVEKEGDRLVLDFPSDPPQEVSMPSRLLKALRRRPLKTLRGRLDYLLVYGSPSEIEGISPDFKALSAEGERGVIVTSIGSSVDFVSRFFAPGVGIDEDPVTGSAHTTLVPYWSRILGKKSLTARQLSERGGELWCEDRGERIRIAGNAVTYLTGEIRL